MNDCLFFVIRTVIKINVCGGNRFRVYSYVLFFDFNFFLNCNIHIHKTSLSKNLSLHTRPHIVKCQIDVYIYHGISRIFYKKTEYIKNTKSLRTITQLILLFLTFGVIIGLFKNTDFKKYIVNEMNNYILFK